MSTKEESAALDALQAYRDTFTQSARAPDSTPGAWLNPNKVREMTAQHEANHD